VKLVVAALVTILMAGCVDRSVDEAEQASNPPVEEAATCEAASQPVVVRHLGFVGLDEDGKTRGLNIDDRVSDRSDEASCYQADFESVDGLEGIDNQFGKLLPALEVVGGQEAVESAVQRAINTGSVLLVIERDAFEDEAGECVSALTLGRAEGEPSIGADGLIESGQTLDRRDDAPTVTMQQALAPNGMRDAGKFGLEVPMQIDRYEFDITIHSATIRYEEAEDGSLHGFISGAIVVDEFLGIIRDIEDGTELLDVAAQALQRVADLEPDAEGECQKLSVTMGFEAVPVHFWQ